MLSEESIDKRPLLCLTMIVKDEASSIDRVLRNVLPQVDMWAILDTGSTDGTQVCVSLCSGRFHAVQRGGNADIGFSKLLGRVRARALFVSPKSERGECMQGDSTQPLSHDWHRT